MLNFKIIVEVIEMYEFMVSCVILNKYMVIFCGIFEFKYFFFFVIGVMEDGDVYLVEFVCYKIK